MISGIYGHIYIETVADGIFENAMITYKLIDSETKKWVANITSNYTAYKPMKKDFSFTITGEDIEQSKEIISMDLKEGINKIIAEFIILGYGKQLEN